MGAPDWKYSCRSDRFSFGATIYNVMANGDSPDPQRNWQRSISQHQAGPNPWENLALGLTRVNEGERFNADDVRQHSFMSDLRLPASSEAQQVEKWLKDFKTRRSVEP